MSSNNGNNRWFQRVIESIVVGIIIAVVGLAFEYRTGLFANQDMVADVLMPTNTTTASSMPTAIVITIVHTATPSPTDPPLISTSTKTPSPIPISSPTPILTNSPTNTPTQTPMPISTASRSQNISITVPRMRRPSSSEQNSLPKLWDLVNFRDIRNPKTEEYSLRVSSDELIRWTFAWCADSTQELYTILQPLTVRFFVDGSEIDSNSFDVYEAWVDSSRCQVWNSVIYDWNGLSETELEIRYHLDTNISEGGNIYARGTYRHLLQLSIEN